MAKLGNINGVPDQTTYRALRRLESQLTELENRLSTILRNNAPTARLAAAGDSYVSVTDGTNTSTALGADTLKLRSANSNLTIAVEDDNATHGDNALFTVTGLAPSTADYLVKTADGSLSAARVVTDTTTVAWDWATAGQAKAAIVAGSVGPTELAATAVAAGSYGSATQVATFTVDADGRLTAAGTAAITGTPPSSHNILDSTYHGDALTGAVARGALIVGNSTPAWSRLTIGSSGTLLRSDGTDAAWASLSTAGVAASSVTLTAGSGLTGGGDLTANRTFDVGATDTTVTVAADGIRVNTANNFIGALAWSGTNTYTGAVNVGDSLFTVYDAAAPTKLAQFKADSVGVGTSTFILPNIGTPPISATLAVTTDVLKLVTMMYGDGSDGDISAGSFSGGILQLPAYTAGGRDMYWNNVTVPDNHTIWTDAWSVYIKGTLTMGVNSFIRPGQNGSVGTYAGGAASGATGGVAGTGIWTNTTAGVTGLVGVSSGATAAAPIRAYGEGGGGGNGGAASAGGGTGTGSTTQRFNSRVWPEVFERFTQTGGTGGRGGSSGNGNGATAGGGGGGGGAGGHPLYVHAAAVSGSGTLYSPGFVGGAGGTSGGSGGGGGGGGGGGPVRLVTNTTSPTLTLSAPGAAGGAGGTGAATGGTGGNGSCRIFNPLLGTMTLVSAQSLEDLSEKPLALTAQALRVQSSDGALLFEAEGDVTVRNGSSSNLFNIYASGVVDVGRLATAAAATAQLRIGGPTDTANTSAGVACTFAGNTSTNTGTSMAGTANALTGGWFVNVGNHQVTATNCSIYGGVFDAQMSNTAPGSAKTIPELFGGAFRATWGTALTNNTITLMGGCITKPTTTLMSSTNATYACYYAGPATAGATPTITTKYGLYVAPDHSSSNITTAYGVYVDATASGATNTNSYGIRVLEQVNGSTLNYGIFLDNATSGYKAIAIRDANAWIGSDAAGELTIGGTTCNIKSTNIGFYGTAGVARDTGWTSITNVTTDRAYDANATSVDELADVLGTLIAKLVAMGLLA